jgi:hypothetical protein
MVEKNKAKELKGYEATREANKHVKDPVAPGVHLELNWPTSKERMFSHRANVWPDLLKGRSEGPCSVLVKFMLPCGDFALKGDTFDPIEERMSKAEFMSLHGRKFFAYDLKDTKLQESLTKFWSKK